MMSASPYGVASGGAGGNRKTVYVGNLAWEVQWQDLKDHFKGIGNVVRADVMTEPSGRSKGCGMVEFSTEEEARSAIETLHDSDLKGRLIFVREDRGGASRPPTAVPQMLPQGGLTSPLSDLFSGYPLQQQFPNQIPQFMPYIQQPFQQFSQPQLNMGFGPIGGGMGMGMGLNKRLYVGNLSWEVAWQDLKDHFKQIGNVIRADVMVGPDGRSKGCGIVEYATPEEARMAIERLHDTNLKGRLIFVREDREAPGRIGGGSFGGGGGAGGGPGCRVYVGNLDPATTWAELKDHFKVAGNCRSDIPVDPTGKPRGYGIVSFDSAAEAATAIATLNDSQLHSRILHVREDREEGR